MDVPRVESHARLVQQVDHVLQAAAQVPHQLHPLGLAARQRVGRPVQAQVLQPDAGHAPEPLDERCQQGRGDRPIQQPQDGDQVADRHRVDVRHRIPVDPGRRCRSSGRREQPSHQRADIRHRSHAGAWTAPERLLVHHHRQAKVLDRVDVRVPDRWKERPHEHAEVVVELALRLRADGVEDQRRLAGARHPGDHRDGALGEAQGHVPEVVLPRAPDLDGPVHEATPTWRLRVGGSAEAAMGVTWEMVSCRAGERQAARGCRVASRLFADPR